MNKLYISIPVWGSYTNLMTNALIPSLLAEGNLPFLSERFKVTITFFTRSNDSIQFDASLKELLKICRCKIVTIPENPFINKYDTMNACQIHAIEEANKDDAIMFLLTADSIMSNNFGECIYKRIGEGKRVIVAQGQRMTLSYLDFLFDLNPRNMVKNSLTHFHPFCAHQFYDSPEFMYSAELYFKVGNEGILCHNFGLAPVVIWPTNKQALPKITLDDAYLTEAVPDFDQYHIIEDSDEGVLFSLAQYHDPPVAHSGQPFDAKKYANRIKHFFEHGNLGKHNLEFFKRPVCLKTGDMSDQWDKVKGEAKQVVDQILEKL